MSTVTPNIVSELTQLRDTLLALYLKGASITNKQLGQLELIVRYFPRDDVAIHYKTFINCQPHKAKPFCFTVESNDYTSHQQKLQQALADAKKKHKHVFINNTNIKFERGAA